MHYAKWSSTWGLALCLLAACSSAYTPLIQAQTSPTPPSDATKVASGTRDADSLFVDGFEVAESGVCAGFYPPNFAPVIGQIAASSGSPTRPAKAAIQTDPSFGTCVVRATDHAAEPPSGFARNDYSRRQAFNSNNSRFIVYSRTGHWHLYDADTLQYLRQLSGPAGDAEPQWHATDPQMLYYVPTNGGTVIKRLNVETNQSTTVADFVGRLPWSGVAHVWTKSEGSPSADGRYWCLQAETDSFGILGVFTYDLQTNQILGTRSMSERPDHVSMSASGRWCIVSSDGAEGTRAWNPAFSTFRQLHHKSEHSDAVLGADGDDYFVFVNYQSNAGDLVMVNIDGNVRTSLFPTYLRDAQNVGTATAYHVSGKAFSKPGWFLLSTYAQTGGELWLHERIMAVELSANPLIVNVAHHHSFANGYWTEPHASVSRDFTRVLFTSNWGSTSAEDVDAYLVRLPPTLLP